MRSKLLGLSTVKFYNSKWKLKLYIIIVLVMVNMKSKLYNIKKVNKIV